MREKVFDKNQFDENFTEKEIELINSLVTSSIKTGKDFFRRRVQECSIRINYKIKSLEIFKQQIKNLDPKSNNLIKNKIQLIKENHYRYEEFIQNNLQKSSE